ncbi:hypothetical protein SNEBB_001784 [Seison nebaliae]|nr:hypothetical protein SNEBB_001784 [Seison nebaliae]
MSESYEFLSTPQRRRPRKHDVKSNPKFVIVRYGGKQRLVENLTSITTINDVIVAVLAASHSMSLAKAADISTKYCFHGRFKTTGRNNQNSIPLYADGTYENYSQKPMRCPKCLKVDNGMPFDARLPILPIMGQNNEFEFSMNKVPANIHASCINTTIIFDDRFPLMKKRNEKKKMNEKSLKQVKEHQKKSIRIQNELSKKNKNDSPISQFIRQQQQKIEVLKKKEEDDQLRVIRYYHKLIREQQLIIERQNEYLQDINQRFDSLNCNDNSTDVILQKQQLLNQICEIDNEIEIANRCSSMLRRRLKLTFGQPKKTDVEENKNMDNNECIMNDATYSALKRTSSLPSEKPIGNNLNQRRQLSMIHDKNLLSDGLYNDNSHMNMTTAIAKTKCIDRHYPKKQHTMETIRSPFIKKNPISTKFYQVAEKKMIETIKNTMNSCDNSSDTGVSSLSSNGMQDLSNSLTNY